VAVERMTDAVALSAWGYTCALRASREVHCWPVGNWGFRPMPIANFREPVEMAVGGSHACARLRDGRVLCRGYGGHGSLGDGSFTQADILEPRPVKGLADAVQLAAGWVHTCALRRNGRVACWGQNEWGALGDGTRKNRAAPVEPLGVRDAVEVRAGLRTTCARLRDGAVLCWGQPGPGQDAPVTTRPTRVAGLGDAAELAGGGTHFCARRRDGTVACWGDNSSGQRGVGDLRPHPGVSPVPGLQGVLEIKAGNAHTCARLQSGRVVCWGANLHNQVLGKAPPAYLRPTAVRGLPP